MLMKLALASRRWPNPDLPVSTEPADHLEAVTMEPTAAAEIETEPDPAGRTHSGPSQGRSILAFAALGVLTGVLSWLAGKYANPEVLRFSFWPFGQATGAAPILPGVVFGLLVGSCCRAFGSRDWLKLAVALLMTTAAWIAAWDLTAKADSRLGNFHELADLFATQSNPEQGPDIAPRVDMAAVRGSMEKLPFRNTISFGIGGLVGGFGTCLAVALANARFRRPGAWLLTLLVATILGALEPLYDLMGEAGLLALFVLWQSAVIASIARGLARYS